MIETCITLYTKIYQDPRNYGSIVYIRSCRVLAISSMGGSPSSLLGLFLKSWSWAYGSSAPKIPLAMAPPSQDQAQLKPIWIFRDGRGIEGVTLPSKGSLHHRIRDRYHSLESQKLLVSGLWLQDLSQTVIRTPFLEALYW